MDPLSVPLERLPTSLARRAACGDFSPEVANWLCAAFRRHVQEGAALEAALRLDRVSRLRDRDDALRMAAGYLVLGDESPWIIARRLLQAVAHQRRKQGPPSTPLEMALAVAIASGIKIPTSQRQIKSIIR